MATGVIRIPYRRIASSAVLERKGRTADDAIPSLCITEYWWTQNVLCEQKVVTSLCNFLGFTYYAIHVSVPNSWYISLRYLSMWESVDISAVWYTNLSGIVPGHKAGLSYMSLFHLKNKVKKKLLVIEKITIGILVILFNLNSAYHK